MTKSHAEFTFRMMTWGSVGRRGGEGRGGEGRGGEGRERGGEREGRGGKKNKLTREVGFIDYSPSTGRVFDFEHTHLTMATPFLICRSESCAKND